MTYLLLALFLVSGSLSVFAQDAPQGFTPYIELKFELLNTYPHDTSAFTQGLLWHEGSLYESTGQEAESTLREVNPVTGEVIRSIPVTNEPEDPENYDPLLDYFAEGLELVDGQLIQLTWKDEKAFVYDLDSFELLETIEYDGQGWGICSDDRYYYMSDSTQYLAIREIDTFELVARMLVTVNGQPINRNLMNELECVGDVIYANLYFTNYIAKIDKFTGNVIGLMDAGDLLSPEQRQELPDPNAVLNGIAYQPETDTFFITGKYWPSMFEIRITEP